MPKACSYCEVVRPDDDFIWHKKDRLGNVYATAECKRCVYCRSSAWAKMQAWYKKNPGKQYETWKRWHEKNPLRQREIGRKSGYKNKYGVSVEDYERMYIAQNGCCRICERINVNGKRLSIDHDHKTGRVRGLLCHPCNVMIGLAKENPHTLYRAVDYLENLSACGRVLNGVKHD